MSNVNPLSIIERMVQNDPILIKIPEKDLRVNTDRLKIIDALKSNKTVTSIDFGEITNKGSIALAEALKINKTLISMSLRSNLVLNKGAMALAEALKLNKTITSINLYLNLDQIGKDAARALAEVFKVNQTISSIGLSLNQIGNDGTLVLAEALKVNQTITSVSLNIYYTQIIAEGVKALADAFKENKTITRLVLNSSRDRYSTSEELEVTFLEGLKENKAINTVHLSRNQSSAAICKVLEANTTLTSIDFTSCKIEREGAIALAEGVKKNETVTSINLQSNEIGEEGAEAFAKVLEVNKTITWLNLKGNKIGNEGAEAFAKVLEVNKTLTSIDLSCNGIVSIEDHFPQALKINETLTSVNLGYNQIVGWRAEEQTIALAEALKVNKALKTIQLFWTQSGSIGKGAIALAHVLKINKSLTSMDLSNQKEYGWGTDGTDAAAAFAGALEDNESLKSINFKGNRIGSAGAIALAETLESNKVITSINLSDTGIDDEGVSALATALKINKTITEINLVGNHNSNEGVGAIAEVLKVNEILSSIGIGIPNEGSDEGAIAFAEALKTNKTVTSIDLGNVNNEKINNAFADALKINKGVVWINHLSNNLIYNLIQENQRLSEYAFHCVKKGDQEAFETSLNRGVSINAKDGDLFYRQNNTLLHVAVKHEKPSIVRSLLENGAISSIPNEEGETPLDLAKKINNQEILTLFEKTVPKPKQSKPLTNPFQTKDFSSVEETQQTPPLQKSEPLEKPPEEQLPESPPTIIDQSEQTITESLLYQSPISNVSLIEEVASSLKETLETPFTEKLQTLQKQLKEYTQITEKLQTQKQTLESKLSLLSNSNETTKEDLASLKNNIALIEAHQNILREAHQIKQAKKAHLERLKNRPNEYQFYLKLISSLENLIISAKAASGPFAKQEEGTLGKAANRVKLLGELFDLVPLVGQWGDKLIKGTAVKTLTTIDEQRQKNLAQRISDLATLTDIQKQIEETARYLTECYSRQLNLLVPLRGEKNRIEKTQRAILKKEFLSHSQKVGTFVSLWIYEAFIAGKINDGTPIQEQIIQAIMVKKPRGEKNKPLSKISHKLEIKKVKTENGEKWTFRDFLTKPGIETENGELYKALWTKEAELGYCLGTKEMAEARGLSYISTASQKPELHPSKGWQTTILAGNKTQKEAISQIERIEKTMNIRFEGLSEKVSSIESSLREELKKEKEQRLEVEKELKQLKEMLQQFMEKK